MFLGHYPGTGEETGGRSRLQDSAIACQTGFVAERNRESEKGARFEEKSMDKQDLKLYYHLRIDYTHRSLPPDGRDRSDALDARTGKYRPTPEILFSKAGEEEIYFLNPIYARLPRDLMRVEPRPDCLGDFSADPQKWSKFAVPDWGLIAKRAGLDSGEKRALQARVEGKSRGDFMGTARGETERLALQASWKRLERHWDAVLKVLKSSTGE